MPKQLFDGFGNPCIAYTQAEVDALLRSKNAEILRLRNRQKQRKRRGQPVSRE